MLPFEKVNVSIIGFNSLMREGISRVLNESEFQSYHFFPTIVEAMTNLAGGDLSVAIVDVEVAGDTLKHLSLIQSEYPSVRVILMVDVFEFRQTISAFQKGACAYLLKEIGSQPLINSLRLVIRGEKVLPVALLQHLPDTQLMSGNRSVVQVQLNDLLSAREIDTLRCLVMGYSNKVIAYRLLISEATVKVHVKAILRKLTVQNRTQAAIWAVNQGVGLQSGDFRGYAEAVPTELTAYSAMNTYDGLGPMLAPQRGF